MKVTGVIPSRYGSTRLPAKPLADIPGKPMVWCDLLRPSATFWEGQL